MTRCQRGLLGPGLTLVIYGSLVSVALPDIPWYEAYDRGLKAIESRQWALAEKELRAAMQSHHRQGRRVRAYGVQFIDYIPSYHLAVVYSNQERHREALEELQRVEASGLVSEGDPEYALMSVIREKALARLPSPSPPPKTTLPPEAIPDQRNAETPPFSDAITREAERQALADPGTKSAEVDALIQSARRMLAARNYKDVRGAAEKARATGIADPRIPEIVAMAEMAEGLEELARLVKGQDWIAAREKAAWLRPLSPGDPELRRQQALIDKHFAASNPSELERSALLAFYEGRYEAAAGILEVLAAGEGRTARSMFFLACSHSALAFLGGKEGAELLSRANQEFAQAVRLGPIDDFDQRWISPRIIHVFEQARRSSRN